MDSQKVNGVCEAYRVSIHKRWNQHYAKVLGRALVAKRFPEEAAQRLSFAIAPERTYAHFLYMAEEIPRLMEAGRVEKAMRWLGWLQGALWGRGMETLEEAKLKNAPEGAAYSRDA